MALKGNEFRILVRNILENRGLRRSRRRRKGDITIDLTETGWATLLSILLRLVVNEFWRWIELVQNRVQLRHFSLSSVEPSGFYTIVSV
jgi:hypothetical protein